MRASVTGGVALTFGPEGGIEASELAILREAGWTPVAIARTTLRFETAGVAGVAIVRAGSMAGDSGD